jgi:hypothetical protein
MFVKVFLLRVLWVVKSSKDEIRRGGSAVFILLRVTRI